MLRREVFFTASPPQYILEQCSGENNVDVISDDSDDCKSRITVNSE